MVAETQIAEYLWLGGHSELRSKTRVFYNLDNPYLPKDAGGDTLPPVWNYDGSSTAQASGHDSEVILHPVAVYWCPFRKNNNILVLCETRFPDNTPTPTNHREQANKLFLQGLEHEPWYGIEQEFFLFNPTTQRPLGFPARGGIDPNPQGQYYCSVGTPNAFGRQVVEDAVAACLIAGIRISGINAEVAPGQWEYQVGPVTGIEAGDQVWVSRYILERVAEQHGVIVNLEPKPIAGDWNGSGCHTNYSTKQMREPGGIDEIYRSIKRLVGRHDQHMKVYGSGNEQRMTGEHETASYDTCSYGVADRGASIRIGRDVVKQGCGYFEDRRPSSNMDPYQVTSIIFETTVLLAQE